MRLWFTQILANVGEFFRFLELEDIISNEFQRTPNEAIMRGYKDQWPGFPYIFFTPLFALCVVMAGLLAPNALAQGAMKGCSNSLVNCMKACDGAYAVSYGYMCKDFDFYDKSGQYLLKESGIKTRKFNFMED